MVSVTNLCAHFLAVSIFLFLEKNEVTETRWLCLWQVRQNPKEGSFFVQNLKRVAVVDYPDIERRIEEGMICSSSKTAQATLQVATFLNTTNNMSFDHWPYKMMCICIN